MKGGRIKIDNKLYSYFVKYAGEEHYSLEIYDPVKNPDYFLIRAFRKRTIYKHLSDAILEFHNRCVLNRIDNQTLFIETHNKTSYHTTLTARWNPLKYFLDRHLLEDFKNCAEKTALYYGIIEPIRETKRSRGRVIIKVASQEKFFRTVCETLVEFHNKDRDKTTIKGITYA